MLADRPYKAMEARRRRLSRFSACGHLLRTTDSLGTICGPSGPWEPVSLRTGPAWWAFRSRIAVGCPQRLGRGSKNDQGLAPGGFGPIGRLRRAMGEAETPRRCSFERFWRGAPRANWLQGGLRSVKGAVCAAGERSRNEKRERPRAASPKPLPMGSIYVHSSAAKRPKAGTRRRRRRSRTRSC